jgi:hypothetical protein
MNFKPGDLVYWIDRGKTMSDFILLQFAILSNDGNTIFIQGSPANGLTNGTWPWAPADFPMKHTVKEAINVMQTVLANAIELDPSPENVQYSFDFQKWIEDFIF